MKKIFAIVITVLFFAANAYALDLDSARKSGTVGERPDGYIAAVGAASPEVSALVKEVNDKRRKVYEETSKNNGQPLDVVQKIAADKVIQKLSAGEFYMDAAGKWVKK